MERGIGRCRHFCAGQWTAADRPGLLAWRAPWRNPIGQETV